jgi:hypothetical protein
MKERLEINRQIIYLTIDNVRIDTENGIEEKDNQFVAFIKNEQPNDLNLEEQVKNNKGENIVFPSIDYARGFVVEKLKKTIYPPDFLHPLHYKKENLDELMHKELVYDIGKPNSDDIQDTIQGMMVECTLAANPPHLPGNATILLSGGSKRNLTFFDIKRIRKE